MPLLLKAIFQIVIPHQNSHDILHRDRNINPKVHMQAQKAWNIQSNLEQKRAILEKPQYFILIHSTES
jgi:hypothetical protein